jgi:hypothetical protein
VLGVDCRLKLVMASDFTPRKQVKPATPAPPATPAATAPPVPPVEATGSAQTPSAGAMPEAQAGDEEVPEALSQWVQERGGQIKIVPE